MYLGAAVEHYKLKWINSASGKRENMYIWFG